MQIETAQHYESLLDSLQPGQTVFDHNGYEYIICQKDVGHHIEHGDLFAVDTGVIIHFSRAAYPLGIET